VTLERVQMVDSKEPSVERFGEVSLKARVSTRDNGGLSVETRAPERGAFRVSARPGDNFLAEASGLTGRFGPGDESLDAEELVDWRVWYRIEEV
jgi:hypothetical protein